MDDIVTHWCNWCNKRPAEGIAKVVDDQQVEIDLYLCNKCYKNLLGPEGSYSIA